MIIKKVNKRFSPVLITKLSQCEVFVFGSNLQGLHYGGAANIAFAKFGAEWGVGDGPTGQCYAIPTMHGGLDVIRPYVEKFIKYAKENPMKRFLLTRIGCGIAGFKDDDMASLFNGIINVHNIAFPKVWLPSLLVDTTLGFGHTDIREESPKVINEIVLKNLCHSHLYDIGAGINTTLPKIKIRYVSENRQFGYADFGDFFFYGDDLYVWEDDEKWAKYHNQDVVLDVFHDECFGRGFARKVIFAGACTNKKDSKGEYIYTGDVIRILKGDSGYIRDLALGSFDSMNENDYKFILDNHFIPLSDCICKDTELRKIGTVFFQLKDEDGPAIHLRNRTQDFNLRTDLDDNTKAIMAKFTPNFDQDEWKYKALEHLGAEFGS